MQEISERQGRHHERHEDSGDARREDADGRCRRCLASGLAVLGLDCAVFLDLDDPGGRLANAGFSARWPPIIAAEVTISELTDSSIACAKTSCAMLRFKGWPIERWV